MAVTIGVLALQGDVAEHRRALESLGVTVRPVRRPGELAGLDGIVLPGGESTAMAHLLGIFDLLEPLRAAIHSGLAVYGSCAGMILLADRVLGGTATQRTLGGLDVTVRRNAFGRQIDSFEQSINMTGIAEQVRGVFIRAPWVEEAGPAVRVLARTDAGRIVAVHQGRILATAFHPELSSDARVHQLFVEIVKG